MTDFRALCAELAAELDHNRRCLMDDRSLTHPLADRARAALAVPVAEPPAAPVPTFRDAIQLAQGCHDYSGGYGGTPCAEAFHAGIGTVVNGGDANVGIARRRKQF